MYSKDYIERLIAHRIPGLDLGLDVVYPYYAGQSILNIPSSICQMFDIPGLGAGPLEKDILSAIGNRFQRVILVLMDALAWHRLLRWMEDGTAPVWMHLLQNGALFPITSITPSTTSAALTSLWTGRSPAEHGITGYEMWLKEYGIVANTILHTPITYRGDSVGSLERAGFSPEKFMSLPTLGQHLKTYGIESYAFQHHSIIRSGLSSMLFRDVNVKGFSTAADLWINLRTLMDRKAQERMFTWVYWSEVDHFSHQYGPDDERTAAEFMSFSYSMERLFLDTLNKKQQKNTLLLLTADHGQISTAVDPNYELRNHPDLMRRLHISPTGENRLAFLYPRPGQTEAVREYLERKWPGQFIVIDSIYAVQKGLFGPGNPHPALYDRIGDYTVVAQADRYFWWADKDNPLVGRHGGLHPEEMLVPLLATVI